MAEDLVNLDFKKQLAALAKRLEDEQRVKSLIQEGKNVGTRFIDDAPQTATKIGDKFISGTEKAVLSGMDDTSKALVPFADDASKALVPMADDASKAMIPFLAKNLPKAGSVLGNLGSKALTGANVASLLWPTAIDKNPIEDELISRANQPKPENVQGGIDVINSIVGNPTVEEPKMSVGTATPIDAAVTEQKLQTRFTGEETPVEKNVRQAVNEEEVSDPLQSARNKDALFMALNALNKGLSLKDAGALGKKGLNINPVKTDSLETSFAKDQLAQMNAESQAKSNAARDELNRMYKLAQINKLGQPDQMNEFQKERISEMKENRTLREQKKLDDDVQKISTRLDKSGILSRAESLNTIDGFLRTKGVDLEKPFKKGQSIEGIGVGGGFLADMFLDDDAVQFRQNVSSLANQLLKQRSGAAVTDQEYARFLKEVGAGNFSTQTNLMSGLKKMKKDIKNETTNILKSAEPAAQKEFLDRTNLGDVLGLNEKPKENKALQLDYVILEDPTTGERQKVKKSAAEKYIKQGARIVE